MGVKNIIIVASIIICFSIQAQGVDKYTDGNRPYEFGFTIDEEQHRHEKKDENGLIMGEFGFLTADGVYHVTVYATDEQGRFKILSMKNIRKFPYPTSKQTNTSTRQGHSIELPATQQLSQIPVSTTQKPLRPVVNQPANSCSHCSVPTTTTPAPILPAFNQPTDNYNNPNQIGTAGSPKLPQGVNPQSTFNPRFPPQGPGITQNYPETPQNNFNTPQMQTYQGINPILSSNYPTQQQNGFRGPNTGLERDLVAPSQNSFPQPGAELARDYPSGTVSSLGSPQEPISSSPSLSGSPGFPPESPQTYLSGFSSPNTKQGSNDPKYPEQGTLTNERTPKRLEDEASFGALGPQTNSIQNYLPNFSGVSQQPLPKKPTLISAQMQVVDKNTDIYRRGPGERDGLPEGLTKDDMTQLLYTFNYTVGFHGHFEEGYINGAKQGYYYVTGRNGISTRVDYVADSNGFRPKITQEVLDLLSEDVPKPETERDEKYGLKGYEFKWLYYPVESKGR